MQVELWASELVTSVIELSSSGQILNGKVMPLYPPGLLLGVSSAIMRGMHISKYFPILKGRSMSALFTLNGLGGATSVTAPAGMSDHPVKQSNLKDVTSSPKGVPENVGPILHVRIKHQTDDTDIQLTVQVRAQIVHTSDKLAGCVGAFCWHDMVLLHTSGSYSPTSHVTVI